MEGENEALLKEAAYWEEVARFHWEEALRTEDELIEAKRLGKGPLELEGLRARMEEHKARALEALRRAEDLRQIAKRPPGMEGPSL